MIDYLLKMYFPTLFCRVGVDNFEDTRKKARQEMTSNTFVRKTDMIHDKSYLRGQVANRLKAFEVRVKGRNIAELHPAIENSGSPISVSHEFRNDEPDCDVIGRAHGRRYIVKRTNFTKITKFTLKY